ncbi:SRPBCC family protein [Nitrospira sp. KM1]|uniref:SRPBCC family protein n=1 Tax=Nitrospira sp. KM1 TaxID=1936990 RepID=UPI001562EAC6|nr:SRPBCC family protein [Nitrospira sp. KM1]
MRSSGRNTGYRLVHIAVLGLAVLLPICPLQLFAALDSGEVDVTTGADGAIHAKAHLLFSAAPEIISALLTDYAHWPDLFEVRMRVASVTMQHGVATTDLRIEHALMPGERRLITESRQFPDGRIVTDLAGGGDFKRYHREWRLGAGATPNQTVADFELIVAIDTMVPDWMIALATRRELESHFRIVKEKAARRATQER